MQKEDIKKIKKKTITLAGIFLVLGILVVFGLALYLSFGFMARYGNKKNMRDRQTYGYLISGRGCNDMTDASDGELRKYIKEDILSEISKKKFKSILTEEKEIYERGGTGKNDSCYIMIDRVSKIIDGM